MTIIWFYGLPLSDETINSYVQRKQLTVFDECHAFITVVEEAGFELEMYDILPRVGVDLVDHKMHHIIVIHINEPNETEYTSKDEDRLRELLGIREKGRWYRSLDHCDFGMLDEYVAPPLPA